jgi:hypothetical protein
MTQANDQAEAQRKAKILDTFRETKKRVQDHWNPIYDRAKKRKKFTLLGEQLSPQEKRKYGWKSPKEPNLLLTYVNHEANKTLQTDYLGKISPNGGGANILEARVRQSVLRGVQRKANTHATLNYARRDQVATGIAYALVEMGYAGKRGFGKTLKDGYLEDTYNVFPDENVKEPTFADAKYFLIKKEVPENEWEEETGEKPVGWQGKKKKTLWYYWVREDIRDTEYLLEDGQSKLRSEYQDLKDGDGPEGVKKDEVGNPLSRPTTDYKWCWYKIPDEDERILDEEEWVGSYSPLVACTGRRVVDGEKIYYQPITEFAEEAQTMYTILENIIALRLSKSPFSKWKIAFESIDAKAFKELRDASVLGDTDIPYKAFTADGKPIPAPEEIEPHVLDAILIQLQEVQLQKIQRIFGIFDANLGEKSNEQSGVAIEARAKGGDVSNYDSQFAFMLFVEQLTRVKLDLVPKVLTPQQQFAFLDKDDKEALQWFQATGGKMQGPDEEYELAIEATPISNTDREEEANALINLLKVSPSAAQNPKAAAVVAKAMPGRYAAEMAQILAGNDPEKDQLRQVAQEATQKLQQSELKGQQQQQMIVGLKQSMAMMKQQFALFKQAKVMEDQQEAHGKNMEALQMQIDSMEKALDRQVAQYTAESGRITAEAAILKAVGSLIPEPATPKPGEALP